MSVVTPVVICEVGYSACTLAMLTACHSQKEGR